MESRRWRRGKASTSSWDTPGGSAAEIKRAYKEMARRYHPDVCPTPDRTEEYTRLFIVVQEAYETLSDPGRRRGMTATLPTASTSISPPDGDRTDTVATR
ncbi:unnamed protein product [Spirodela intermedia]|uniref:J domain-containing protein n=1 Tax=Spirodela intermedia TaxID=51605 RepID=A0A7I8JDX8_SPIIN|nr:unnamed protein product [Spirodela intermedia]CAA6668211.1 unnamed protein product [Spirodela intermedia]